KLSTTGYGAKTFVYHKSKKFSVENMDEIIKKLNKENFNYLFFLFNDLQGKNYGNIKNLVSQISADNKIVMNKLLKKFIFS
ncbi:hypothetical protein J7L67_02785, partial [bacterium]|nr:hypothetical protein [bacterium]